MFASSTITKTDLSSWHSQLGHPSLSVPKNVVSKFSLPVSQSHQTELSCSDCFINKSHKLPFHSNTTVSHRPLEYLYSDVWMSPITSADNAKYYLLIVDHFTRYSWMYPLQRKSQVKEVFVVFVSLVENRFQAKVKTLYSDNGSEYIALRSYLREKGISHLTTRHHTKEHNGVSDRKHRHIVETGLTLLSKSSVPKTFWPFSFAAAVYLINRMPTEVLSGTSPYEKLFQQPPNYMKLRVFGCSCYPWLRPYTSHKMDDRSTRCVFMGYSLTQSAYLCYDSITGCMYTSRHVKFNETEFPYNLPSTSSETRDSEMDVSPSQSPLHTVLPVTAHSPAPLCPETSSPPAASPPAASPPATSPPAAPSQVSPTTMPLPQQP